MRQITRDPPPKPTTVERARGVLADVETRLARAREHQAAAAQELAAAEATAAAAVAEGREVPAALAAAQRALDAATTDVRLHEGARAHQQEAIMLAARAEREHRQRELEPRFRAALEVLQLKLQEAVAANGEAERLLVAMPDQARGFHVFGPLTGVNAPALDYLARLRAYLLPAPARREPDPSQIPVVIVGRVAGRSRGERCMMPVEQAAELMRRGDVERIELL
jgi:hypothetical protein